MGLLDGDIQKIVFGAFTGLFLDGTLTQRTLQPDTKGGTNAVDEDPIPIKLIVDPATQLIRHMGGWPPRPQDMVDFREDDVALLILAYGIPEPRLDDRINVRNADYHVMGPIILDAAMATYLLRGRKI